MAIKWRISVLINLQVVRIHNYLYCTLIAGVFPTDGFFMAFMFLLNSVSVSVKILCVWIKWGYYI